jgi:thiol-disulfide isomerase/thioredoxin
MKKSIKWIALAVVLVVLLVGAYALYNKYSEEFKGDNLSQATQTTKPEQASQEQGQKTDLAPNFTVYDEKGNEVKLSDYRGKPVVLNFWATWCYYCKEEMPDFNKAYKEYPDVQFLMINATDGVQETKKKAMDYVEAEGFDFPVLYDTETNAVRAYYISSFPSTFFIDANGELVTYANGMLDYETLTEGIGYITE